MNELCKESKSGCHEEKGKEAIINEGWAETGKAVILYLKGIYSTLYYIIDIHTLNYNYIHITHLCLVVSSHLFSFGFTGKGLRSPSLRLVPPPHYNGAKLTFWEIHLMFFFMKKCPSYSPQLKSLNWNSWQSYFQTKYFSLEPTKFWNSVFHMGQPGKLSWLCISLASLLKLYPVECLCQLCLQWWW